MLLVCVQDGIEGLELGKKFTLIRILEVTAFVINSNQPL